MKRAANIHAFTRLIKAICSHSSLVRGVRCPSAILVLPLALTVMSSCTPSVLPPMQLRSTTENPADARAELCEKVERCIIVYLTPWCPDCRASVDFIKAMRERLQYSPRIGFQIIVGGERDPKAVDAMAQRIGGKVYLDYDRDFQYAARIIAVPHWFVLDEKRQIVEETAGSPREANANEVLWWLEDQLNLGPYVNY